MVYNGGPVELGAVMHCGKFEESSGHKELSYEVDDEGVYTCTTTSFSKFQLYARTYGGFNGRHWLPIIILTVIIDVFLVALFIYSLWRRDVVPSTFQQERQPRRKKKKEDDSEEGKVYADPMPQPAHHGIFGSEPEDDKSSAQPDEEEEEEEEEEEVEEEDEEEANERSALRPPDAKSARSRSSGRSKSKSRRSSKSAVRPSSKASSRKEPKSATEKSQSSAAPRSSRMGAPSTVPLSSIQNELRTESEDSQGAASRTSKTEFSGVRKGDEPSEEQKQATV